MKSIANSAIILYRWKLKYSKWFNDCILFTSILFSSRLVSLSSFLVLCYTRTYLYGFRLLACKVYTVHTSTRCALSVDAKLRIHCLWNIMTFFMWHSSRWCKCTLCFAAYIFFLHSHILCDCIKIALAFGLFLSCVCVCLPITRAIEFHLQSGTACNNNNECA